QRHWNAERGLDVKLRTRVIKQENGRGVEGDEGVEPLEDFFQRPVQIQRGAECDTDLRQEPIGGSRGRRTAGDDLETARVQLASALRHGAQDRRRSPSVTIRTRDNPVTAKTNQFLESAR